MQDTRGRSILSLLVEYRSVVGQLFQSKAILGALSLMVITSITNTVNTNFWSVLFTKKLGFADSQISIYTALTSVIMTIGFFLLGPRLTNLRRYRLPLWLGFAGSFFSQALLVFMPPQSVLLMIASVVLSGIAGALLSPMIESLLAVSLETGERARISAMVYVTLIIIISPFGWIAGQLSAIDRALPFALNMILSLMGAGLVWLIGSKKVIPSQTG